MRSSSSATTATTAATRGGGSIRPQQQQPRSQSSSSSSFVAGFNRALGALKKAYGAVTPTAAPAGPSVNSRSQNHVNTKWDVSDSTSSSSSDTPDNKKYGIRVAARPRDITPYPALYQKEARQRSSPQLGRILASPKTEESGFDEDLMNNDHLHYEAVDDKAPKSHIGVAAASLGSLGNNCHFQVQLKLVLLDSLLLRLKTFYGNGAESICDQSLFVCILDVKRRCSSKQVDLSILTEIDCLYQQLIDNENIFRLERHSKLEKHKFEFECSEKQQQLKTKCDMLEVEANHHRHRSQIAATSIGAAILLMVVAVFIRLIFLK
jgi:hypothetical protein